MNNLVAFDTETTGVEPGSRLVEIAAILFRQDGDVIDTFQSSIDPGMPMPPDASLANGITANDFAGSAPASEVLKQFLSWIPSKSTLVAHNAPYDLGIITWELARAGLSTPINDVIDTLDMARNSGSTKDNKLQTLVTHYSLEVNGDAHRALPDADAVRQLFMILHKQVPTTKFPWTSHYSFTDVLPKDLERLPDLVSTGSSLTFDYFSKTGVQSRRTITPYGWALTQNGLTIHGLCHKRNARRTFYADRMLKINNAHA